MVPKCWRNSPAAYRLSGHVIRLGQDKVKTEALLEAAESISPATSFEPGYVGEFSLTYPCIISRAESMPATAVGKERGDDFAALEAQVKKVSELFGDRRW